MGAAAVALVVALVSSGLSALAPTAAASTPAPATAPGPAAAYRCTFNVNTDAFTGADGTASAIGWLGDHNSVITCLGGTFVVQDGPGGLFQEYGFGIYDGQRTTWADADGYLPAQVTTFADQGATVSITELADRVVLGGSPFVAVYSRVRVDNPTGRTITLDPGASSALVPLGAPADAVPAHHAVDHDYVVAADRFGVTAPWPSAQALATAGGFDQHFAHMRAFWNGQLTAIAQVRVPDPSLVDAYSSGFITTQITRSGNDLDTGVNGYETEYSHDVIGILTNLFTQGYFTDAHALLTEARNAVGHGPVRRRALDLCRALGRLPDEDRATRRFVAENFATEGPTAPPQPSIEDSAHAIAAGRTGPTGIMESTDDIDTQGYWTIDDYEALSAWPPTATSPQPSATPTEATWATDAVRQPSGGDQHDARRDHQPLPPRLPALLACSNPTRPTAARNPRTPTGPRPCASAAGPGTGRSSAPPVSGPGLTMIDATYDYGFARLARQAPAGHRRRLPRRLLLERATTPATARPAWPAQPTGTRGSWATSS